MAEFFFDYGLFLLKVVTIVVAIIVVIGVSVTAGMRTRKATREGHIEVTKVNDEIDHLRDTLCETVIDPYALKTQLKQRHKAEKTEHKANIKKLKKAAKKDSDKSAEQDRKRRLFVAF